MRITLKHLLQELAFIEISEIKRHSKGLLKALENSNREEMLDYLITDKKERCEKCESEKIRIENFYDDYGFERLKIVCESCGEEKEI